MNEGYTSCVIFIDDINRRSYNIIMTIDPDIKIKKADLLIESAF